MYVKIKSNAFKIKTLLSCVYVNSAYDKQINIQFERKLHCNRISK